MFLSRRRLIATSLAACAWRSTMAAEPRAAPVTALAFAPDGDQIVSGSQGGVSIRDSQARAIRGTLATEMGNVHDLCFSPDGRLLAVAGGTPGELGVVEMWDWPSCKLRHRFETHDDVVYQVAFADDGVTWVAASADEVCSVFRLGSDEPSMRFTKHSRAVLAVVMLPDGKTAVSASRDETLRVWDTSTSAELRTLHNHSRDVHALALQSGGGGLPLVASASADGTVRFWQPTIGRMVRFARLPSEPLSIAWVAGGKQLVAGCRDGKARLIDPVAVSILSTIDVFDGWLFAIAVDPTDQRRIAIGSTSGRIRLLTI